MIYVVKHVSFDQMDEFTIVETFKVVGEYAGDWIPKGHIIGYSSANPEAGDEVICYHVDHNGTSDFWPETTKTDYGQIYYFQDNA